MSHAVESGANREAPMPQIEVESYFLALVRYPSNPGDYEKKITLAARDAATAAVKSVFMEFFPPGDATGESTAGYQPGSEWMRVYVAAADFDVYWRLLQTERPVYFSWRLEGGTAAVQTFWMSTRAEPTGEGTSDATWGPAEAGPHVQAASGTAQNDTRTLNRIRRGFSTLCGCSRLG